MIKKTLIIRPNKLTCIALLAPLVVLTIQFFFLAYFNLFNTTVGERVQLLSKFIVGLIFLPGFIFILKKHFIKIFHTVGTSLLVFSIYYIIFPLNNEYIRSIAIPFFFINLPVFLYSNLLDNFTLFKKYLRTSSKIIFIFSFLLALFVFMGQVSIGQYSMAFAYYMLLPTIVFIDEFFERKRLQPLIYALISFFIILALGSRGPILCILIFAFLKVVKKGNKMTYQKAFFIFLFIIMSIILSIFLMDLLGLLNSMLLDFGIKSRTIDLFLRRGSIHLSGRDILFKSVWETLSENPFRGLGLAGDRVILNGSYVHNFFLELFAHYGVLLGGFAIITVIFFILKAFFISDNLKYSIFIFSFCIGFVHLMISSSYLIDYKFWMFLGFLFNKNLYCNKT